MKNKKIIYPLQYLRIFMLIFVTFEHFAIQGYSFIDEKFGRFLRGGTEGVLFFFVLSGFVMYLSSFDKTKDYCFKQFFVFIFKKIKTYIIVYYIALFINFTYLIIITYLKGNLDLIFVLDSMKKLLISATFLQVFFINESISFNTIAGVGWYFSVLVFCYVMSFFAFKFIRFISKRKLSFSLFIFLIFSHFIYTNIMNQYDSYHYFIYIFPLFRFLEYFLGILLAFMIAEKKVVLNYKFASFIEIFSVILLIINHFLLVFNFFRYGIQSSLTLIVMLLIIFAFSCESGFLSKHMKRNRIIDYLVSINFEIYMFHYVLLKYISLFINPTIFTIIIDFLLIFLVSFLINKILLKEK